MTSSFWLRGFLVSAGLSLASAHAVPETQSPAPDHREVPGVVIDHCPAASLQYIGSPSLAVLTNADYVASHDLFGPGSTLDRTRIFVSTNRGLHWSPRGEIQGQWWSTLFVHDGALYLLGTSRENGFVVIRKSSDGGINWSTPRDPQSGLLRADGGYHCAPVPVVAHAGRIWRAMEDTMGPKGWGNHFRAFMMSAPMTSDLLNADNWTFSKPLGKNRDWLQGRFGGWLEGNAVVTPEGKLVDILRVDYRDAHEQAAIIEISHDGRDATFDPSTGFVGFPGGCKKFTIRFDQRTSNYWSLANYVPPEQRGPNPERIRNTLALIRSPDLRHWAVRAVLLQHPDPQKHAFQYVDWLFDGSDIIAVARTAFDDGLGGAHNQHDANFLTFHRFRNFRDLRNL